MKELVCLLLVFLSVSSAFPTRAYNEKSFYAYPLPSFDAGSVISNLDCDLCEDIVSIIQNLLETNTAEEDIVNICISICIDFKIEDENVCSLIVPHFKDEVLTVFDRVALKPSEACGVLLGQSCGSPYDPWDQKWVVPIPNIPKPPVNPILPPLSTAKKSRILHLSDFHYDELYTPGLSNDCGEPLCCRPPNPKGNGSTSAGYWGDYNCDVPLWTLENLLQHLGNRSNEFDWVYWTGDLPAHNVWNQSRDDQLNILKTTVNLMKKYLPDKVVFPSLGNHESAPCNSFPPPYITGSNSNQWLLNAVYEEWSEWLSPYQRDTIKKGGYYSTLVTKSGLRVISLQTNYCNKGNWWLLINSTDPADQLRWLVNELTLAEENGQKVHIIGHIPPGHGDCAKTWSYNYHKIINRFESTVVGQFFGHSHVDELQVYYDEQNTSRPMNFALIGPSVTTYTNFNMGYRIYTIDGDYTNTTNSLLDFETFYMNITDANLSNVPKWIHEYSSSKDYHMTHCFPQDFDNLVKRFEKDDSLFQKYYNYMTKLHPPTPHCDSGCKATIICAMKTSRSGDHSLCDNLPGEITIEEIHAKMKLLQAC